MTDHPLRTIHFRIPDFGTFKTQIVKEAMIPHLEEALKLLGTLPLEVKTTRQDGITLVQLEILARKFGQDLLAVPLMRGPRQRLVQQAITLSPTTDNSLPPRLPR